MDSIPPTLLTLIGTLGGGVLVALVNNWRKPSAPAEAIKAASDAVATLVGPLTDENERIRREWRDEVDALIAEHTAEILEWRGQHEAMNARLTIFETLIRRLLSEVNGAIPPALRTDLEEAVS